MAAVDNQFLYVVGGTKLNGTQRGQINTVEVFDIKTNTWSDIPPLPVEIHHPNVAGVDGKVFVVGVMTDSIQTEKPLKMYIGMTQ